LHNPPRGGLRRSTLTVQYTGVLTQVDQQLPRNPLF
jgi:hypothetical protein